MGDILLEWRPAQESQSQSYEMCTVRLKRTASAKFTTFAYTDERGQPQPGCSRQLARADIPSVSHLSIIAR